ncbi:MAG: site-2 protease family protein [Candidatus Aenigmatarchaeota archaeon]
MNNMLSPFDFTRQEIKEILISLVVLAFVFAYPEILTNPIFILTSLLGVGIAFFGHEMAHRYVARKRGFYSAYKMWPQGLLLALVMAFATNGNMVFAAPGAVIFAGYWMFRNPTIEDIGIIGIAGVVFNLTVMYFSLSLYFWTGFPLFSFIGTINGWLAIFNLIPFGPLDGKKVMDWNLKIWLAALALAITGFAALLFF